VQANGTFGLGQVIGIRPDVLKDYEFISSKITQGSLDDFGKGRGAERQIAIGARLAQSLGLRAGDVLTVYSPRVRSSVMGQSYIYMDIEQSTALFEGGKLTGQIQVRLNTPDKVDQLEPKVEAAIQSPSSLHNWRLKNQATATAF